MRHCCAVVYEESDSADSRVFALSDSVLLAWRTPKKVSVCFFG